MKKLIITLIAIITLVSCSSNQVTISRDEYNKLKGITTVVPEYPKPFHFQEGSRAERRSYWYIVLAEDNHEYLESTGCEDYTCMHYIDCKLCLKRLASQPFSVPPSIDTIK